MRTLYFVLVMCNNRCLIEPLCSRIDQGRNLSCTCVVSCRRAYLNATLATEVAQALSLIVRYVSGILTDLTRFTTEEVTGDDEFEVGVSRRPLLSVRCGGGSFCANTSSSGMVNLALTSFLSTFKTRTSTLQSSI